MIEEIKNKEKQEYFRGQRKCLFILNILSVWIIHIQ